MGFTPTPSVNTALPVVVVSMAGRLASSSLREASVTEAHPNDRAAIAKRAKRDLTDFMGMVF